ncbi:hypothetical protein Vretimale_14115 [Volvox reticuliferus]|nr:hypothetical protein Vretimale_14115 [Volvox reticuliferus]
MLFNTVVVLLATNCEPLAKLARESQNRNWTRFFVKYGSYSDFTPGWYENVGLSILILMIINVSGPLLNLLLDEALLIARRCWVLYCIKWPLQSDYDVAWSRPRFTLAQRIADLLLNVSLALLFGSGMPLLYLVLAVYVMASELADRWALTRLCRGAPRYNTGLMKLVMALLPWMAVAHCAFGLWMHTYFRVVVPENGNGIEGVSHLTTAVNSAALTSSSNLSVLQRSSVWHRITQPNGLSLLLVMVGLVLWLVLGRYVVWRLLSCLGRAAYRLCGIGRGACLMRLQLDKDTQRVLNAVPYGEALVTRQLHGTPTYRLAHHPYYQKYFGASGLNRVVGVAALVMAAANGGVHRRSVYTRLTTVQRRGRLPSTANAFRILPAPVLDRDVLTASEFVFGVLGLQGSRAASLEEGHQGDAENAEDPGEPQSPGPVLQPLSPMPRMSRVPKPPAGESPVPGAPDVRELLMRDAQQLQLHGSIPSLVLGPGQPPPEQQQSQPQQASASNAATAAAVVRIVPTSDSRPAGNGADPTCISAAAAAVAVGGTGIISLQEESLEAVPQVQSGVESARENPQQQLQQRQSNTRAPSEQNLAIQPAEENGDRFLAAAAAAAAAGLPPDIPGGAAGEARSNAVFERPATSEGVARTSRDIAPLERASRA